jgi:hypothetical protein
MSGGAGRLGELGTTMGSRLRCLLKASGSELCQRSTGCFECRRLWPVPTCHGASDEGGSLRAS